MIGIYTGFNFLELSWVKLSWFNYIILCISVGWNNLGGVEMRCRLRYKYTSPGLVILKRYKPLVKATKAMKGAATVFFLFGNEKEWEGSRIWFRVEEISKRIGRMRRGRKSAVVHLIFSSRLINDNEDNSATKVEHPYEMIVMILWSLYLLFCSILLNF